MQIKNFKKITLVFIALFLSLSLMAQEKPGNTSSSAPAAPKAQEQQETTKTAPEKAADSSTNLRAGRGDSGRSQEQQETIKEFRGTRFLQLDKLTVNNEFKKIDEEVKQNIIDTIISSKTHTQIFSQRRPEGYSSAYANFYGLEIELTDSPTDPNKLDLRMFYYNWTTNKSDKELKKQISKFNVLNELRFGIYELLNGKDFVRDNYNRIQRSNYNRIQTIRKIVEEKEKKERDALPKKKLD